MIGTIYLSCFEPLPVAYKWTRSLKNVTYIIYDIYIYIYYDIYAHSIFQNRGLDMDATFFETRDVDMDVDTA